MKNPRSPIHVAAIVLGALAGPAAATAQSYGVGDQVLTIGVSEFKGIDGAETEVDSFTGYVRNPVPGPYFYYIAPLPLPEGALVRNLCAYVNDSDPTAFGYVQTRLVAQILADVGDTPATVPIPDAWVISSSDGGYGRYCSDDFDYTLRGRADIAGDEAREDIVYYVEIYLPSPQQGALGFGGARITWQRQVSVPPLAETFTDVPNTHPFYAFIEALAGSEITGGCGGGSYCPDSPLTRGQMAVFLAKALGLHWAD